MFWLSGNKGPQGSGQGSAPLGGQRADAQKLSFPHRPQLGRHLQGGVDLHPPTGVSAPSLRPGICSSDVPRTVLGLRDHCPPRSHGPLGLGALERGGAENLSLKTCPACLPDFGPCMTPHEPQARGLGAGWLHTPGQMDQPSPESSISFLDFSDPCPDATRIPLSPPCAKPSHPAPHKGGGFPPCVQE